LLVGLVFEPEWDDWRIPVLDRGVIMAIAHIRGGQELGRRW
jgi:oligopeptidase B